MIQEKDLIVGYWYYSEKVSANILFTKHYWTDIIKGELSLRDLHGVKLDIHWLKRFDLKDDGNANVYTSDESMFSFIDGKEGYHILLKNNGFYLKSVKHVHELQMFIDSMKQNG